MRYISLLITIGLVVALPVSSQTIQILPVDPAVKSGTLPNGMAYYVAANPSLKGMADFAVVQKTGAQTIPGAGRDRIVSMSQKALSAQYRLTAPSVQDYFLSIGAVPGVNGFAEVTDNATVFRFENILLSQSSTVLDSTLLVLMGMAEKSANADDTLARGWYAPADQALIVAGDVDPKQIVEKIRMLSYMLPASGSFPRGEYVWTEQDTMCVRRMEGVPCGLSTVSAVWRLQRTPREFMNTVQPTIYEKYMMELGIVAKDRIRKRLKSSGIPYADISYDYVNGVESLGDESFRISLSVDSRHLESGLSVMASVLSDLDASGAGVSEVRRARQVFEEGLIHVLGGAESNSGYVDRCVCAFMYNSPLTSKKDMLAFHHSRRLEDDLELQLFNSIVTASIDGTRNLTVEYVTGRDDVSDELIRELFRSSWTSGNTGCVGEDVKQEPSLYGPGEPVKVKSQRKDPLSGGTVWTLSNGFKVVVKKMPSGGRVFYSLSLNGGLASISDLCIGEGAYVSDALMFSTIGGVSAEDFFEVVRKGDMAMKLKVGFSSFALKGHAPEDGLERMVRMLLTVMNDRKTDRDELDYYMKCRKLHEGFIKGSLAERIESIDAIMCPDYRYSSVRHASGVSDGFADKVDRFMTAQAGKMNDGMLILVGDVDERQLKTVLQMYGGGFKTIDRTFSRPVVNYQPIAGTVRRELDGKANSVDIVLSVPMALTSENHYVAAIASMALRKELAMAVSCTGISMRLKHDFRKDPHERLNMMISLDEASVEGFVPGTAHEEPLEALRMVRGVLSDPQSLDISATELSSYKALLIKHMAERKKDPEYWRQALATRYLEGKDFTTGCDAKINAVTVEKVKTMLSSLVGGSGVEYIISKR